MQKTFIILLLLSALLLFNGCIQTTPPKPTPIPVTVTPPAGYTLSFKFEEGTTLFNKAKLNIEIDGKSRLKQEMQTVSLVEDVNQDVSTLKMVMLEVKEIDANGSKNICESMEVKEKKSTVKISPTGKADFEEYSRTFFYLPKKRVNLGDTWEFEKIEYTLEERVDFNGLGQKTKCLKISFDGMLFDNLGTKWVHGYFLFDPVKHLKVKEKTIVERATSKRVYENELTRVEPNFSGEIDYSCVYPYEEMSLMQKASAAQTYFNQGDFLGALTLSKAANKELSNKTDLNSQELEIKKETMLLFAQSLERTNQPKKALNQRFETAQFFEQFLSKNKIQSSDFTRALENYKKVAGSEHSKASQCRQKFNELNARIAGKLKGKVLLSDTGKSEGLKIQLFKGNKTTEHSMKGFAQQYSIPVLDLNKGDSFKALFYKDTYEPRALPSMTVDKNTLSKQYTVILKRMKDQNKGYLAGLCYSLNQNGKIKKFHDLNFQITKNQQEFTAECSDGFYSILLEPGTYTLPTEQEFEVKAGKTTIAHLPQ